MFDAKLRQLQTPCALASVPFYRNLPSTEVVRARTASFLTARVVDMQTTEEPEVMSDFQVVEIGRQPPVAKGVDEYD